MDVRKSSAVDGDILFVYLPITNIGIVGILEKVVGG
jgi:hypothetical protein